MIGTLEFSYILFYSLPCDLFGGRDIRRKTWSVLLCLLSFWEGKH
jgi:hypothetical protein